MMLNFKVLNCLEHTTLETRNREKPIILHSRVCVDSRSAIISLAVTARMFVPPSLLDTNLKQKQWVGRSRACQWLKTESNENGNGFSREKYVVRYGQINCLISGWAFITFSRLLTWSVAGEMRHAGHFALLMGDRRRLLRTAIVVVNGQRLGLLLDNVDVETLPMRSHHWGQALSGEFGLVRAKVRSLER